MGKILIIKSATYTGSGSSGTGTGTSVLPTCSTPAITAQSGTVTITCATSGATIRYTTDGTPPTASSPAYDGPFTLQEAATVKAIATKSGYNDSLAAQLTVSVPTPIDAAETAGYYLSRTDGQQTANNTWTCSGFIAVPQGATKVTGEINIFNALAAAICMYDDAQTFIGYHNELSEVVGTAEAGNSWGRISADIPTTAAYIRYCYSSGDKAVPDYYKEAARLQFE